MTAPQLFVNGLRTQGQPFKLGSPSGPPLQLRAQVLEAWDAIRIDADPLASVRSLKQLALRELYPDTRHESEYVVKLHGFEVLDEDAPISSTAAKNGSTFLITDRRRRPVD
ncbi:MAG: hypothetical protein AUG44_02165 [Actinobacteria bacterium 13_1_20CM_3_71_11]|nr:MAG: hypothetical protein AUG44_02165 [Actinobacteria bacterium 13_1_20CM_3_71_11]